MSVSKLEKRAFQQAKIRLKLSTLRRRFHHRDVDAGKRRGYCGTSGMEGLDEPLLGNYGYDDRHSNGPALDDSWDDDERKKEQHHWKLLFSHLIAQWTQWLANIIGVSGTLIGRIFPSAFQNGPSNQILLPSLSPLQGERLGVLQQRLQVSFDGSLPRHQDALKQLWRLAYPEKELPSLKSKLWKAMGWQGDDPSTDFRGGGYISLENLIYFAKTYPDAFQNLLYKRVGSRAQWEYPFAIAGINISFMLVQMLDLQGMPKTTAGVRFLELLGKDEMTFDDLYCIAFQIMDAQWLLKRASYMEFNDVLKSTRVQLERELDLEYVSSAKDLPAYNMLIC